MHFQRFPKAMVNRKEFILVACIIQFCKHLFFVKLPVLFSSHEFSSLNDPRMQLLRFDPYKPQQLRQMSVLLSLSSNSYHHFFQKLSHLMNILLYTLLFFYAAVSGCSHLIGVVLDFLNLFGKEILNLPI